jgi:hypothetical protein
MPVANGQGYSEYTAVKQEHFTAIIAMHLKIVSAIISENTWPDKRYWYFDLTAGSGSHPKTGAPGSPLIFLGIAERMGVAYQAMLIERESAACELLGARLASVGSQFGSTEVLRGDHCEMMRELRCVLPPRPTYGLAYCDPSGDRPAFELLAEMSQWSGLARVDFLVNCSATNIKREYRAFHRGRHISDDVAGIAKRYWLVREPYGKFQWTFLLGTNWDKFPEYRKIGLYRLSSPEGQAILERLAYSEPERKEMASECQYALPLV